MLFILMLEIASKISNFKQSLCKLEYRSVLQYSDTAEDENPKILFMKRSVGKSVLAKRYLNGAATATGADLRQGFISK